MHSIIVLLCSFSSGLLLLLSGNTLNFWLASEGVNLNTVGFFSAVTLPYAINFLWAPVFDKWSINMIKSSILQREINWYIILHICVATTLVVMSYIDFHDSLSLFACMSVMLAFFSSSSDSVVNAIRSKSTAVKSCGVYSGVYILGYRLGMLVSGAFAIMFADSVSWGVIYRIFAVIAILIAVILYVCIQYSNIHIEETSSVPKVSKHDDILVEILQSLGGCKFIVTVVIFLIIYRLPDNLIGVMINPFLLHIGFSASEIASAGKLCGIVGSICGGIAGGNLVTKYGIRNGLLYFGAAHMLMHLLYIIMHHKCSIYLLFLTTICESITGGMVMAAYIAFITSLCTGDYVSTKYAFFSSMMGVSRSIIPSISGILVVYTSWDIFFIIVMLLSIPALCMIKFLTDKLF
jgi:PAT family beta-lactamase induction signal transducer AmpG